MRPPSHHALSQPAAAAAPAADSPEEGDWAQDHIWPAGTRTLDDTGQALVLTGHFTPQDVEDMRAAFPDRHVSLHGGSTVLIATRTGGGALPA
ncbi:hypothetical protein [Streptomyces xinghaiensis]|uniref:hypothetical protein n=1 Tax=Streptomyces xinghaiensis TaxID=1038928 RepID=UPI0002DF3889|nr:hypothetical protein [Streptomyces xinghaiensis]MZE76741.1 hypothetical protein [Streptomyces sp. SID5475]